MSHVSIVASTPPSTGITRDCDLTATSSTGALTEGLSVNSVRNLKTGLIATGVVLNQSGAVLNTPAGTGGQVCVKFPNALGNGMCIQYGMTVNTVVPTAGVNDNSFSLRRGVTRIVSTMFASDTPSAINNDVGMICVIGGGGIGSELTPVTGGGIGKTGFGVFLMNNHQFNWAQKLATDAAGNLSDVVPIPTNPLTPIQYECRIFDATLNANIPANTFARVELWVNGVLFLTRYWTNPPGIVTQLLSPLGPANGGQFIANARNTSLGPANIWFSQWSLIHGPNNEGTI